MPASLPNDREHVTNCDIATDINPSGQMFNAFPVRTKRDHARHKVWENLQPAVQKRIRQYLTEMWMVSNAMVGSAQAIYLFLHRPAGLLPDMLADLEDFGRDFLPSDIISQRVGQRLRGGLWTVDVSFPTRRSPTISSTEVKNIRKWVMAPLFDCLSSVSPGSVAPLTLADDLWDVSKMIDGERTTGEDESQIFLVGSKVYVAHEA
ncbi:hypothetical protein LTR10_003744 [Elasticomyces elasticus]|nr:hypothetical protein LTR10_003744 [Elasticomyces elasticus]KAK4978063.1 hypothetical protein LTR42_002440 [Elasticomyces elasticus]